MKSPTREEFEGGPWVVLFRGRSLVSRLIRLQTRGEFSHAAIVIDGTLWEAREGRGVIRRPWGVDGYPDSGFRVLAPRRVFTAEEVGRLRLWLDERLGAGYDYRQVFRFITRMGLHPATVGRYFCSEYVFDGFDESLAWPLFEETAGWEVSPDLLKRTPRLVRVPRLSREIKDAA